MSLETNTKEITIDFLKKKAFFETPGYDLVGKSEDLYYVKKRKKKE